MRKVMAVFRGTSSLGYENGKEYKIKITEFAGKVVVERLTADNGKCEYATFLRFLDNWTDIRPF